MLNRQKVTEFLENPTRDGFCLYKQPSLKTYKFKVLYNVLFWVDPDYSGYIDTIYLHAEGLRNILDRKSRVWKRTTSPFRSTGDILLSDLKSALNFKSPDGFWLGRKKGTKEFGWFLKEEVVA